MSTRVYVPSTMGRLREIVAAGASGPAAVAVPFAVPFVGHAVTDAVRMRLSDLGEEEWEYAASTAAAQSSVGLLALLDVDEPARRVVIAVDVPDVRAAESEDPTMVLVEAVAAERIGAVLADSQDAEATVTAARDAVGQGAPDASRLLERCLDHELGWWATQELGVLLAGGDAR